MILLLERRGREGEMPGGAPAPQARQCRQDQRRPQSQYRGVWRDPGNQDGRGKRVKFLAYTRCFALSLCLEPAPKSHSRLGTRGGGLKQLGGGKPGPCRGHDAAAPGGGLGLQLCDFDASMLDYAANIAATADAARWAHQRGLLLEPNWDTSEERLNQPPAPTLRESARTQQRRRSL
jgi:hypothetical protein